MLRLLIFVFAVAYFTEAARVTTAKDLTAAYTFEAYIQEYSKHYPEPTEYSTRAKLFQQRLVEALQHNSAVPPKSWKIGINHFSDWTDAELAMTRGYKKALGYARRAKGLTAPMFPTSSTVAPPIDWRLVPGVLSAVKDQGRCGSCWTFASSSTIESRWATTAGMMSDVSPQQIASCTKNPLDCGGSGGCEGGIAELAFESVINNGGIASEWTYPYVSYEGQDFPCKYGPTNQTTNPIVKLTGYQQVGTNDYEGTIAALQDGPIAITVDASTWHSYESGIFDGCNQANPDLDHNVQLVGYGVEGTTPYWIVRNSWSPYFGEKGFIRLLRDTQTQRCGVDLHPSDGSGCNNGPPNVTVCGTCGILFDNSYPTVSPIKP